MASKRTVAAGVGILLVLAVCSVALSYLRVAGHPAELRVGYHDFAPFTQVDATGQPVGMAVEIVKLAAARSGVPIRWIHTGTEVDVSLRKGVVDLYPILTLTDTRRAEFYPSEPWWENESILVSLETNHINAGPDTAGKKIAIRGLAVLKALAEISFPKSELVTIPTVSAMTAALCRGEVDAAFLDIRLLQSQLLQGPEFCAGHPLYVASVPNGALSLATMARKEAWDSADRIYTEIASMAVDGTLSATASRWSMVSSFQNRHLKEVMDSRQRSTLMRLGLGGLTLLLVLTWIQTGRIRRARKAAEESEQRFEAFMAHTPAFAFVTDSRGSVAYRNRPIPPALIAQEDPAGAQGTGWETTRSVTLQSGEERHYLCLRFPFKNALGEALTGSVALDITDRRNAEDALRFSQFSIERSPDSVLWLDESHRVFYANEAACKTLGYPLAELKAVAPSRIGLALSSEDLERGLAEAGTSRVFETEWQRRDGSRFPVEVAVYHVAFDCKNFVCCIGRDITAHKQVEAELSYQAQHDLLTGLPNRRALEIGLVASIERAEQTNSGFAVFYLDLDGFKFVNDTLGHAFGDALLQHLSKRIDGRIRKGDMLARMGGDEFAVIALGIEDPDGVASVAERLMDGLLDSFHLQGHELTLTASIGVSLYPRDGTDGDSLLRYADAAMYEAKREGKNRVRLFDPAMKTASRERLELENHLRRALERNELSLHFQPEVSLTTNRVVRYEALLRWNNPVLGNVAPNRFVPIAEETGMIVEIGEWALEQACRHGKRLLDCGVPAGVGVNVSSIQLARPEFVETVTAILLKTGLPPRLLDIEMTETAVMQGVEEVTAKLAKLRNLGVTISLDDFGTGHSSLSHLLKLRADHLKIDQSFVKSVPHDVGATSLTSGLVSLAHSLGMKVVIEGVENRQQLEAIRAMGCDIAQGYLLGRPAPALSTESTVWPITA